MLPMWRRRTLKQLEEELERLKVEKEAAIQNEEFEKAADLRDQESKVRDNIEELRREWQNRRYIDGAEVTENDIAEVVASWTGIPVAKLEESEAQRLLRLEEVLHKRVVGQDEAVEAVARAVRRAHAGLKNPRRPVGSFLFLGPTGVGKTELARALAEALFGSEDAMIRLDMSEYMERAHCEPSDRGASRIRWIRGGRAAHGEGEAPAVLGGALRRDREGAP